MSTPGFNWISYLSDATLQSDGYTNNTIGNYYNIIIKFLNDNENNALNKMKNSGSISSITNELLSQFQANVSDPTDNTAVKLTGYFTPNITGNWIFNLGYNNLKMDDVGILFLGEPGGTIIPDVSFSSVSSTVNNTTPIMFNTWWEYGEYSKSVSLIAGNSYPILIFFNAGRAPHNIGLSFSLEGNPPSSDFSNFINTNIIPPRIACFKEGSKILTNNGYISVQNLRKGDLIKTSTLGFKPIYMIGKRNIYHSASKERIKNQLYKCSRPNYPEVFDPLILTGCHSILVDNFIDQEEENKSTEINNGLVCITDGKYRLPVCVDKRASVYETPGNYTIYHFALENDDYFMNYGIYANGLLVETCSKRYLKELSNMEIIE
jgi:hypothetical protein